MLTTSSPPAIRLRRASGFKVPAREAWSAMHGRALSFCPQSWQSLPECQARQNPPQRAKMKLGVHTISLTGACLVHKGG